MIAGRWLLSVRWLATIASPLVLQRLAFLLLALLLSPLLLLSLSFGVSASLLLCLPP